MIVVLESVLGMPAIVENVPDNAVNPLAWAMEKRVDAGVALFAVNASKMSLGRVSLPEGLCSYAVFNEADLSEANFDRACLVEAQFNCVCLRRASFRKARCVGADFIGADLTGADFNRADLTGANLTSATLNDVYFTDAQLDNIDLTDCDLSKVRGFPADVPRFSNLAERVYAISNLGDELDMSEYHSDAGRHCLAGWTITLAGEDGRKLAVEIGCSAAAALIWWHSDGVVPDFFTDQTAAVSFLRQRVGMP